MRRIAQACFLLVFSRVIFGCDAPHGFALSELRYVPDCSFSQAAVAVGDDGALAAWHFTHVGFGTVSGTNYGAPLDDQGQPRVQQEIAYGGGTATPAIATDGHDFLLVLSDANARIVHADGSAEPFVRLRTTFAPAGKTLVVWTGSEYLVVTPDLLAVRVSRSGAITNVNTLTTGATLAALTNNLVIWKRGSIVEAAPIGGSGVAIPSIPSTAVINVASNGNGFLAVFADGLGRVAAVPLDISGNPAGAPIEIAAEGPPQFLIPPQVAFDGDSYLVLWGGGSSIQARRVSTGGALSPPFIAASGFVWSAVPARNGGTLIAFSSGCGAISTRVIARGASNGTPETVVSLHADAQNSPRLAATPFGHQSIWFESNTLYTRFISNGGGRGAAHRLSNSQSLAASIVAFRDGSMIVWHEDNGLYAVRLDASGNGVSAVTKIPSTYFVFSVSLAAAGDEVLIVTSGEEDLFKNEVDAVRIDADANVLQRVVLSSPGEDGFFPVAGGDASHWFAAWRNKAFELAAIEMPHADLRTQTRTSTTLPTTLSASLGAITAGDDPAVIWTDGNIHATYIHSRLDILLAGAKANDVRAIGGQAFWTETASGTTRILSTPISHTPAPAAQERACLAAVAIGIDYDVRNGDIDAIAYPDGPQLRLQVRGFARRRAVQ